jgi:hypothetical protein
VPLAFVISSCLNGCTTGHKNCAALQP